MRVNRFCVSSRVILRAFICALALLGLTACNNLQLWNLTDEFPGRLGPLEYLDWARTVDSESRDIEIVRLEPMIDSGQQSIASIQLATLLGISTRGEQPDLRRALDLLQGEEVSCLLDNRCHRFKIFALFWHDYLVQQRQLGIANASASTAELEYAERVAELTEMIALLRQQIDDLTKIERQIIEREQPTEPQ